MRNIKYPIKCICYCASNYDSQEKKVSFDFWVRGHLIRIIGDKPFSRGDMIWLDEITYNERTDEYILSIRVIDDEPYEEDLPVLILSVSRLLYSVDDFDIVEKDGVRLLKSIYVHTDESLSLAFISLVYGDGRIFCKSKSTKAIFDLDFKLSWIRKEKNNVV